MNIFDCFTYFREVETLRIRLEELNHTVHYFVLVEATQTFTGRPKPLYYDELPEWIGHWKDRIIRIVVDFPRPDMTPWERETYQRNQIVRGLDRANPEDVVIISDADEIPRASAIEYPWNPMQLDVVQYFWNFNWQVPAHCNQGGRPVVVRYRDLEEPQTHRAADLSRIPYGGWHFSFLGDKDQVRSKIESFSHTEVDKPEFKALKKIQYRIDHGIDPFDRFPLKWTNIDSTYPQWLQDHPDLL